MKIPSSTYYYRLKTLPLRREQEAKDWELKELIENIQQDFPAYGYRKIFEELRRRGTPHRLKILRRVQRKFKLFSRRKRGFRISTTDSNHNFKVYPNLLKNYGPVMGLDEVWVADITYIKIVSGFVYLAVILDLCSRKAIGWAISEKIDTNLSLAALELALERRTPMPGCIHHSDRGVQYASGDYVTLLKEWGLKISMSRKGNPYDNAWSESFMSILKCEEIYLGEYDTIVDVVEGVSNFIDEVYNRKRIHSSIGYLTPEEFEEILMKKTEDKRPTHF